MKWFPEAVTKLTPDKVSVLGFLLESSEELEDNLVSSLSDKSYLIVQG